MNDSSVRACACGVTHPADALFCAACGSALTDDPRLGRLVLGRYRLLAEIGSGGMGVVYRAEQRIGRFTRTVAVKLLHSDLVNAPSVRARFARECEVVAELSHPNTVTFYDYGTTEDGSIAIVMEYVEGETLAKRLERGPLAPREALRIARAIAGSLSEAHALGIVHRDLKPDNVLLYPRPGEPDGVKVLDFGVAKRLPTQHTPTPYAISFHGEVLGTPAYMSPEQITGGAVDARSDVYAMGVLLYEMVSGGLPFEPGSNLLEWADQHLNEPPTPLDVYVAGLDPSLSATILGCLSKRADDRPADAGVLLSMLSTKAPSVAHERPTLPPPAPTERSGITTMDTVYDDDEPLPRLPAAGRNRALSRFASLVAGAAIATAALVFAGVLPTPSVLADPAPSAALAKEIVEEAPTEYVAVCEEPGADDAVDC